MKHKRKWMCSLLGCCCLAVISMLALTGNASAAEPLLFVPLSESYPYHLAGVAGKNALETVGGVVPIQSSHTDFLLLVLSPTLADAHVRYLGTTTTVGGTCSNTSQSGTILMKLLAHFGQTDPGALPAVLMLIPGGFGFTCKEIPILGEVNVLMRGSIIGPITHPPEGALSLLLGISFKQTSKGVQEFKTFLLGSETFTNQREEVSINEGGFEEAAQQTESILLKALAGEGEFFLASLSNIFELSVSKAEEIATFIVRNKTGAGAKLAKITPVSVKNKGEWYLKENEYENCEKVEIEAGKTCKWKAQYLGPNLADIGFIIRDEKGGILHASVDCDLGNC